MRKFLNFIFITLIVGSTIYILKVSYDIYTAKQQTNLLNEIVINEDEIIQNDIQDNVVNERMLKVVELQKENPDIKAWIEIENTNINYPVLQCDNNEFYMNHNYKKDYSSAGSIFLDKEYSWNPKSTNLLIYGHNMMNSTMFQNLLYYQDMNYYFEHPTIRFTTTTEDSYYEIISVFESRTYYKSEQNVFRYYYFINAQNKEEFDNFILNAKNASLYDTGKTAEFGDELMTLSTCAYHVQDGKFVVVAKKISNK